MNINIIIVDDHQIMREGLCSMFEPEADITVVGEAENGRDAMQLIREKHPHLVIMDINMPDLNGIDATRQLVAENPEVRIIALSMHSDKYIVTEMLKAGASAYLLKDCSRHDIIAAVRAVASGNSYLSPEITGVVIDNYVKQSTPEKSSDVSRLTGKEREVLQLLAEGLTSKEIATRLGVAAKTIESHRSNLMRKLDIHTIADLTKFAIRHGITCLDV